MTLECSSDLRARSELAINGALRLRFSRNDEQCLLQTQFSRKDWAFPKKTKRLRVLMHYGTLYFEADGLVFFVLNGSLLHRLQAVELRSIGDSPPLLKSGTIQTVFPANRTVDEALQRFQEQRTALNKDNAPNNRQALRKIIEDHAPQLDFLRAELELTDGILEQLSAEKNKGSTQVAEEHYRKAVRMAELHLSRFHNIRLSAETRYGMILMKKGQYREARKVFLQILPLAALGHDRIETMAHRMTSACAGNLGETTSAVDHARKSCDIMDKLLESARVSDRPNVLMEWVDAMEVLINAHMQAAQRQEVAAAYRRFEEVTRPYAIYFRPLEAAHLRVSYATLPYRDPPTVAEMIHIRNRTRRFLNQTQSKNAWQLYQNVGEQEMLLADWHRAANDYTTAISLLKAIESHDSIHIFELYMRLIVIFRGAGNVQLCQKYLSASRRLATAQSGLPQHRAMALDAEAAIANMQGDHEKAIRLWSQALEIGELKRHANMQGLVSRCRFGLIQSNTLLNRIDEASRIANQWKRVAGKSTEQRFILRCWLADLARRRGESKLAINTARKAVRDLEVEARFMALFSKANRRSWLLLNSPEISLLKSIAFHCGESAREGYEVFWRLDQIAAQVDAPVKTAPELTKLREQLRQRWLAQAPNQEISHIMAQVDACEKEAAAATARRGKKTEGWQASFAGLEKSVAVVDFDIISTRPISHGDAAARYVAFIILPGGTNTEVVRVELPPVSELHQLLGNDVDGLTPNHASQLRKTIWDHIEPSLNGRKRIIVVPSGQLWSVPWAGIEGSNSNHLIQEGYAFRILPSLRPLAQPFPSSAIDQTAKIGLVGDVDYSADEQSPPKWKTLASSKLEVDTIQRHFSPANVTHYNKSKATEPIVMGMLQSVDIAHFATHGFYDSPHTENRVVSRNTYGVSGRVFQATIATRWPFLYSGLALADANKAQAKRAGEQPEEKAGRFTRRDAWSHQQDGLLRSNEIADLPNLRAKLVVLSACHSKRGVQVPGDVVQGLTEAFHQAGVANVLSSLWRVDDESPTQLMDAFYHNAVHQNQPLDIALANAQRKMLSSKYPHPKFWAGFQLSGP